MPEVTDAEVQTIPIDKIYILNPRVRTARVFREVIDSIATVGLKRPITVARRVRQEGTEYDLVCGQGRLEACQTLGQATISALVIDATTEDCLVMSLVENLARRKHRSVDLLFDVHGMRSRGYTEQEIAVKTGLKLDYTKGIIKLLEKGERKLLRAVETGQMPISMAVEIAESDDQAVQKILQKAYEDNVLRGRRLIEAKRLLERRRRNERNDAEMTPYYPQKSISVDGLLRTYKESAEKKRLLVRRAELTKARLTFVVEALRRLVADAPFVALLAAENLGSMPQPLSERLNGRA